MGTTARTALDATDAERPAENRSTVDPGQPHAESSDPTPGQAFAGRVFEALLGATDLLAMYLGDRLGFYAALADGRPTTAGELAARTGSHERYAREWLEQQAVSDILEVVGDDSARADGAARRYRLPAERATVLLAEEDLTYGGAVPRFLVTIARQMDALVDAYRSGAGVAWATYGAELREGQAAFNRPVFANLLARQWLPAIPDVHARLQAPARVADVGCGGGWSSIAIARAYPNVRVDGFDTDAESIDLARRNAAAAGLEGRLAFHVHDAAQPFAATYDLVAAFETIHDLSRPVAALRGMRKLAAEDGIVLVMDERVGDEFSAPGSPVERLFYGSSILVCLPVGMAEQPSAATGTVMRPVTLRAYAAEAGYRDIEILPIEHDLFRLYRLLI